MDMELISGLIPKEIEIIDTGLNTGQYNMDYDMQRTRDVSKGDKSPMFRLYAWKPWCLSLGYNQKDDDIDIDECRRRNIDVVRRPTGGRAVLHADEITYSIVCDVPKGYTIQDIYREVHLILLKSFEKLGCEGLDFVKTQPDFAKIYKEGSVGSVSCFASSARHEIELNGNKIVGSAQRLFGSTLLQHGSILIGRGHELLPYLLKTEDKIKRKKLTDYIHTHSATLSEAAGRNLDYNECSDAISTTLMEYCGRF